MRGDIILYRSHGTWYENLIVKMTHGPYVHVGIDCGNGKVVAALSKGIAYSPYVASPQTTCVPLVPAFATAQGVGEALVWAETKVGKKYGWLDIVYQAVKVFAPNNPFQLVQKDHYDCSDFVTRYLEQAHVKIPENYQDPYANTPNDIGRILGALTDLKPVAA
jgi:uncharacterized protein YycO